MLWSRCRRCIVLSLHMPVHSSQKLWHTQEFLVTMLYYNLRPFSFLQKMPVFLWIQVSIWSPSEKQIPEISWNLLLEMNISFHYFCAQFSQTNKLFYFQWWRGIYTIYLLNINAQLKAKTCDSKQSNPSMGQESSV